MNSVLNGTTTKIVIRKVLAIYRICKSILLSSLTAKVIVDFMEKLLQRLYIRQFSKDSKKRENYQIRTQKTYTLAGFNTEERA